MGDVTLLFYSPHTCFHLSSRVLRSPEPLSGEPSAELTPLSPLHSLPAGPAPGAALLQVDAAARDIHQLPRPGQHRPGRGQVHPAPGGYHPPEEEAGAGPLPGQSPIYTTSPDAANLSHYNLSLEMRTWTVVAIVRLDLHFTRHPLCDSSPRTEQRASQSTHKFMRVRICSFTQVSG